MILGFLLARMTRVWSVGQSISDIPDHTDSQPAIWWFIAFGARAPGFTVADVLHRQTARRLLLLLQGVNNRRVACRQQHFDAVQFFFSALPTVTDHPPRVAAAPVNDVSALVLTRSQNVKARVPYCHSQSVCREMMQTY